jgi:tetratricopeptide (TPR) repeat protein
MAESELKQGQAQLAKRNYQKAVDCFDSAIRHDYKLKKVLLYRGEAKLNLKDFSGAADDYTEYSQFDAKDPDVQLRLSKLYELQNKPNMALSYMSKVLVMRPKDGTIYARRALLYDKLGQKENADIDRDVARKLGVKSMAVAASAPAPKDAGVGASKTTKPTAPQRATNGKTHRHH